VIGSVADRRVVNVLTLLLISVTVLQRFGAPLGGVQLSVSVVVALGGIAYLLFHRDAVENTAAMRVFVLAVAACFLATGVDLVRSGAGAITSLVYLPVVWVVFCFRLHPAHLHLYPRLVDRFERIMVAFAAVGILQTLTQAVGVWSYTDVIGDLVPAKLLFTGYNTSYPIQYGSSIIKANAFVFLEPSVYAQFLALAVLSTLVRRSGSLRTVLLALALVCTISGTGLLSVAFGIAVLAVRRGGRWTARIAVGAAVIGGIALLTPFGQIIASRSGEAGETNSSGSLRFVQPYQRLLDAWSSDPLSLFTGRGAGSADRLAAEIFSRSGLPINFSGLAKLLLEYGVPATVLFSVFVAVAVVRRAPSPTLALSAVFANALLTGALLQPQVLYVMLPLCSLFLGQPYERRLDDQSRGGAREGAGAATAGVAVTVPPARPDGGLRG